MKKALILAAAVAALTIFASCQKEDIEPANDGGDLVFTATIDNPATRTTINTDGNSSDKGKVSWESDDEITTSDAANTSVKYVVSSIDATTGKATFTKKDGETGSLAENSSYTATYGSTDFTFQTYSATAGDLPMSAPSTTTTTLQFSVTCGLLKLHLTNDYESIKHIAVTGTVGGATTVKTLTCETPQSIAGDGADFFIALPAGTYTRFVITDSNDDICTIKSSSGVTIEANKIQPLSFSSKLYFRVVFTDLGLSVKWADCNVGSTISSDYGDYFAWAETEPKNTYSWSNYKYCNGTNNTRTKYCTNSSYGTVDGKTTLDLEDDAAHVNWGGSWRMPTWAELQELMNNCNWSWGSVGGVAGYIATSKVAGYTKNSIFFPAAGTIDGSELKNTGGYGYYMSSSLKSDPWSSGLGIYNGSRYQCNVHGAGGFTVRAVRP